jgi:hypothetical protein
VDGASEVTITGVGPMSLCRILLRLVTFFCLSTYSMTFGCGWLHGVAPNVSVVLFFAIHGEYDPGKR